MLSKTFDYRMTFNFFKKRKAFYLAAPPRMCFNLSDKFQNPFSKPMPEKIIHNLLSSHVLNI